MKPGSKPVVGRILGLAILGALVVSGIFTVPTGRAVPSGPLSGPRTTCAGTTQEDVKGTTYWACNATLDWTGVGYSPTKLASISYLDIQFVVYGYNTVDCIPGAVNVTGQESNGTSYSFLIYREPLDCQVAQPTAISPDKGFGSTWYGGSSVLLLVPATSPLHFYPVTFTETGLANGTTWGAQLSDVAVSGMVECWDNACLLQTSPPNGSYPYTVSASGYVASPSSGVVVVQGAAVSVAVTFTLRPTYHAVTFEESGLPESVEWMMSLSFLSPSHTGSLEWYPYEGGSSPLPWISLAVPNGTYGFYVGPPLDKGLELAPVPAYGYVTVSGTNLTQPITFVQGYEVTFSEGSFEPDTNEWFVNVTGGSSYSSTFWYIAFDEPNGSWNYTVGSTNTSYKALGGSFTVNGTAVSKQVDFLLLTYPVTVTESGIPASVLAKHGWTLAIGSPYPYPSYSETFHLANSTIALFPMVNGTYSVLVGGPSGYTSDWNGTLKVSGTTSASVKFAPGKTVTLAFTQTGLSKVHNFCMEVESVWACSSGSRVTYANLTPGRFYRYGVPPPVAGQSITARLGTMTIPTMGSLNVTRNETVVLRFVYRYAVNFTEAGLPSGAWSVVIDGVVRHTSATGEQIAFNLTNGTYSYRVVAAPGYSVSPGIGRVVVNGGNVSVSTTAYAVTFTESGLPSGTTWTAIVHGKALSNRTVGTTGTVTFYEGNGTYVYRIGVVAGYTSVGSPPKSVTVGGKPASITLTFSKRTVASGSPLSLELLPLVAVGVPGGGGTTRSRRPAVPRG
jgi:hypothetical protein